MIGNQRTLIYEDGTKERELDSQRSFCILKKTISVGPAIKVLDSNGCLNPRIEVAELVVHRLHTSNRNQLNAVSSLEKVGEV